MPSRYNYIEMETKPLLHEINFSNSNPRFFFVYNPESHGFEKIPFQHFDSTEADSENSQESEEKSVQHRITKKPNCITIELFSSKAQ